MTAVLEVRDSCWKACYFPAHKLGVKNDIALPQGLPCVADCCVLLVFVVGGGGSGLWCQMLRPN
eukprot:10332471-Ditylum_brightwellii.AAC.1